MPCSKGEKDKITGKFCPYLEYAPTTVEGFETWDAVQRCSQFKFYPSGKISGLDTPHILEIARVCGYDDYSILLLLEYVNLGLQEALKDIETKEA